MPTQTEALPSAKEIMENGEAVVFLRDAMARTAAQAADALVDARDIEHYMALRVTQHEARWYVQRDDYNRIKADVDNPANNQVNTNLTVVDDVRETWESWAEPDSMEFVR